MKATLVIFKKHPKVNNCPICEHSPNFVPVVSRFLWLESKAESVTIQRGENLAAVKRVPWRPLANMFAGLAGHQALCKERRLVNLSTYIRTTT
jgi:nitrate reductase beta subunit